MLIVALVMAVIGLAALVTAVITSNEIIAWVCIGASVIGVILLIVDALRERQRRDTTPAADEDTVSEADYPEADYPDEEEEGEEDAAAPAPKTEAKEFESEEHEDSETSQ